MLFIDIFNLAASVLWFGYSCYKKNFTAAIGWFCYGLTYATFAVKW